MHPIIAQLEPNEEQEPAVLARGQDVAVTAGAGTGKTRTLVARYLALLAEGMPLRSVVAITFTKKAAREMRNRVRTEIRRFLDQRDLVPEQFETWDKLYNELDAARIGTIHNLCSEILRAHPAEAALDPQFSVLEEAQSGILMAQAVDEGLAWAVEDPAAAGLFLLLGEGGLRRMLVEMMASRLETEAAFEGLPAMLWPRWEAALLPPLVGFVDDARVKLAFEELTNLQSDGTLEQAAAQGDSLAPLIERLLALWMEVKRARDAADWPTVAHLLLPLRQNMKLVGRKAAWQPADPKATVKTLQILYDDCLGQWLGSGSSDKGINLELDRLWVEALPSVRDVFEQTNLAYEQLKEQRQALDFDDLEAEALQVLRRNPAVLERWRNEVGAILVDEYQDTNGRQRDLVNLINGETGRLFIVGDAKQSIYRFRGADVTVFRAERQRIREQGLDCSLDISYRAHGELIEGLNSLLAPVLGRDEDRDRPWREPFAPLHHYRQQARPGFVAPYIEMLLTVGSKSSGALSRAAEALTGYLVALVEGSRGQISYGDMAILCRASTSFSTYEDALDRLGVPYVTVAGRGFFERPEIRDLLNAMRAMADPTDNLALVGFLRSPVIGFSDVDLYELSRPWLEDRRRLPLWHILQARSDSKSGKAVQILNDLHLQAGRAPVADLLKSFLDETDYRAAMLEAGYPRAARNVSKLLADAHASGLVHVEAFLEYVNNLNVTAAREGEARSTAGDMVQIMSVHQAKGLEFSVVIIGDLGYQRRYTAGMLYEPGLGVIHRLWDENGAQSGLHKLLEETEKDKEAAESERLLYVAATRAQEMLILNGCFGLSTSGKPARLQGWFRALTGTLGLTGRIIEHDPDGDRAIRLQLKVESTPVGCTIFEPGYRPRSSAILRPDQIDGVGPWSPSLIAPIDEGSRMKMDWQPETLKKRRQVWQVTGAGKSRRAPAWLVGALVHEALAGWRFPGDEVDPWLVARVRHYGLIDLVRQIDAVRQAGRLLQRFTAHALYGEMNSAERRLHEVPYYLLNDTGAEEHGFIDVLYLRDGLWTVVEFKSDWVRSQDELGQVIRKNEYDRQLSRYTAAVTQLLGQRPRSVLCMLNVGGKIVLHQD